MDIEKNNTGVHVPYLYGNEGTGKKIYKEIGITKRDSTIEPLDVSRWRDALVWASAGYESDVAIPMVIEEAFRNIFNGITSNELEDALILATVAFIERDPAYGYVAARLLNKKLFKEVTKQSIMRSEAVVAYRQAFINSIKQGVECKVLCPAMLEFDLELLAQAIQPDRDFLFEFMGLKTLYERYFTKYKGNRFELPQAFWMRVAMGLSLLESDKNARAVEFYNLVSNMHYVPSTPTLLHSGLMRPQLSSCYLNTVSDDLTHIFKVYGDNAQLSKWSGGIGTDWTNIRSTGAMVETINTESQGLIPFLKIANDVTAAINRSGKRRGAACVYLEVWHMDFEDFLDLKRNTGDERRRTHDINTASWIPDLFMKRVLNEGDWTLFSPDETPELHHLYGKAFEQKYAEYEMKAQVGELKKFKIVSSGKLWRKMLSRLFETGHPWLTFKDPSNIRSPQDHAGVIHNSNLCTEITLNTSEDETAVCNLGSVNLARHVTEQGTIDKDKLAASIKTAMHMLDNVIDINFYPTAEAKNSNMRHRPVGLGVMGFQDLLYQMDVSFEDQKALEIADTLGEFIAYHTIFASSQMAKERGAYQSYKGSKWDRNLFPQDTIDLLEQERGMPIEVSRGGKLDWTELRDHVKKYGMRNSNTMALAPTATISNIAGCFPTIEPIYKNIYVKSNMSGEFTIVNKYLVQDLKKLGLWNQDMLDKLKYFDGQVYLLEGVPQHLKDKYKEAFEIDPEWLIKLTAARSKWIDQSQSHNVFMKGVSGTQLSAIYITAWKAGLKTMYYLRTLGASQIEKSTLDAKKFGFTQKREYGAAPATGEINQDVAEQKDEQELNNAAACSILNGPDCESCQ